jgi:hypothetical protein
MAADLQEVKGMWEMAATLDFLNLFRWVRDEPASLSIFPFRRV